MNEDEESKGNDAELLVSLSFCRFQQFGDGWGDLIYERVAEKQMKVLDSFIFTTTFISLYLLSSAYISLKQ